MAASSPDDCFHYAFMAAKIALENMTPVILLTDAFIGNGSSLWKLPKLADLPEIHPHIAPESLKGQFRASTRDEKTKVRYWAFPGMEGFMHRNGGLEKDYVKAGISTDGENHARMIATRAEKIAQIANVLPAMEVEGDDSAEVLVVGWGSTHGHLLNAVNTLNAKGKKTALLHFNYICPLPKNAHSLLRNYKKVVVCELNSGQFATFLRSELPDVPFLQFNKMEGQPFKVSEIVEFLETL